jgi:hypothetical protein
MRRLPDRWRAAMVTVMLFSQLGSALVPVACLAQAGSSPAAGAKTSKAPSGPTVQRGQEYYEQARFDEAITLLRDLVDRGQLSGSDLQKARELLARAYVKKGYPTQGKDVFKAILRDAPAWRPDPIRVPPDETAVFEQALKEFQAEKAAAAPETPAPAAVTPTTTQPAPETTAKPAKAAKTPKAPRAAKEPKPPKRVKEAAPVASLDNGKKKSGKTLWYVIGGAAVIGIAAAAGGSGGTKAAPPPPVLSGFPPPPTP